MPRAYAFKNPLKKSFASLFDLVGHGTKALFGTPRALPTTIHRLLLIRLDHLGDVICLLPLIERLAARQEKMSVTVCVSPAGATLLRDTPGIEDILLYDAPWFSRVHRTPHIIRPLINLVRTIYRKHVDMSWELRGDLRHHLITTLARVRSRAGYGNTGGGFLLHNELPWNPQQHAIDANLRFLEILGETPPESAQARLVWKPTSAELQWAEQVLPRSPFIAIHPDAGTSAKRWGDDRFAALIKTLNLPVVLIGTNPRSGQQILKHLPDPNAVIDLTGKTTLAQLVTLIQKASRLISCDSGPAHIAAALGTPTFILWSGTNDPAVWAPRGASVRWIRHDVACAPCGHAVCPLPRHLCMEDLSPQRVTEALA